MIVNATVLGLALTVAGLVATYFACRVICPPRSRHRLDR